MVLLPTADPFAKDSISNSGSGSARPLSTAQQAPTSTSQADGEQCRGDLPLHLAIRHGADLAVVDLVLAKHPEGVKARAADGDLPLHCALRATRASKRTPETQLALVRLLLDGYSDALRLVDADGSLPLHLALDFGAANEVAALLLREHEGAAWQEDGKGRLPLHIALEHADEGEQHASANGASADSLSRGLVWQLLTVNPQAARARDHAGNLAASAGVAGRSVIKDGAAPLAVLNREQ